MIEPLRFNKENAPPYAIARPVYCGICLATKKKRSNPGLATKQCDECPRPFICHECDIENHNSPATKDHIRRILVVGPGVKKRVLTRGDAVNFPMPLDWVSIRVSCKVYHEKKLLHSEPVSQLVYQAGLSGNCIHVQILECRGITAADMNGTSDPFIVSYYNGCKLGMTRVRPRTLNPRWNSETIIVPIDDNLPPSRGMKKSQKDLVRLELYDFDWVTDKDFLGHVEIKRDHLIKLAEEANEHPIRLPFTTREFHGFLSVKFGVLGDKFRIKIMKAESLEVSDPFGLSDPFCVVYFGDTMIGKTPHCTQTLDPEWTNDSFNGFISDQDKLNTFEVPLADIESRQQELISEYRKLGWFPKEISNDQAVFRIEVFDYNRWSKPKPMGTVRIPVEAIGKYVSSLYREVIPQVKTLKGLKHRLRVSPVIGEDGMDKEEDEEEDDEGDEEEGSYNDEENDEDEVEVNKDVNSDSQELKGGEDDQVIKEEEGEEDGIAEVSEQDEETENINEHNSAGTPGVIGESLLVIDDVKQSWFLKMICGKTVGKKRMLDRDLTEWSNLATFDVETENTDAESTSDSGDRGQLVVRLIKSIRGNVIKGLDEGVRHMSLGERSRIKVRYDHAYSSFSMGSNIPPRADIVFRVELQKINGRGSFGMPYRQFKRFVRMVSRFIVRWNLLWNALKEFEKRTRFFERIAVFLRLMPKREYREDEDLGQRFDDGDIEYAASDAELSIDELEERDADEASEDETEMPEDDEEPDEESFVASIDPLESIGDTIHDEAVRKLRPERIIKVDGAVLAGAKYIFPHRPRVVLSKRKKKTKLSAAQKAAMREERRRLREERRRQRQQGNEDGDENEDEEEEQVEEGGDNNNGDNQSLQSAEMNPTVI